MILPKQLEIMLAFSRDPKKLYTTVGCKVVSFSRSEQQQQLQQQQPHPQYQQQKQEQFWQQQEYVH